jgi:ATP-dependent DNA ligase
LDIDAFLQGINLPSNNRHIVGHGDIVYQQACKLGCEGIVSKLLRSLYRSGRSKHWLKGKRLGGADARLAETFLLDW